MDVTKQRKVTPVVTKELVEPKVVEEKYKVIEEEAPELDLEEILDDEFIYEE